MTTHKWDPRRLNAVEAKLPVDVVPTGTAGRILSAALKLFAEFGYHGTSIRQIGAEAGINSATLYAHFPSKQHVLAELILIGHRELHDQLQEALLQSGDDPVAQLSALVAAQVRSHADYPLLALVANSELHALAPEHAAPILAMRAQARELGYRVITAGVEAKLFTLEESVGLDEVSLATTAISSMNMQVAHWFGPDQLVTRDDLAAAYVQFALRIVGVPETVTTGKLNKPKSKG